MPFTIEFASAQMRKELIRPAIEETLGAELLVSDYMVTDPMFEDYTKSHGVPAFTEYYDGDIRAFAESERPLLMDCNIVIRESSDDDEQGTAFKAKVEMLHRKLHPFCSGDDDKVCVLSRDYTGELVPYRHIYRPEGS